MKNITVIFLIIVCSATSFSQQIDWDPVLTKQDYLKKSKTQKTVAVILDVVGSAFISIASTIYIPNVYLYAVLGGVAGLASIPFYYSSRKNKRIAMNISLNNNTVPEINKSYFTISPGPLLTLKISL